MNLATPVADLTGQYLSATNGLPAALPSVWAVLVVMALVSVFFMVTRRATRL